MPAPYHELPTFGPVDQLYIEALTHTLDNYRLGLGRSALMAALGVDAETSSSLLARMCRAGYLAPPETAVESDVGFYDVIAPFRPELLHPRAGG